MKRKLLAYAEMVRLPNAPTVVTNVLVGAGLASDSLPAGVLIAATASVLSIYFAGMILNDCFDASHDAAHKPDRPIPAGRVGGREACAIAVVLLTIAMGLTFAIGFEVLTLCALLVGSVFVYDALHKRSAWLCLVMGACRALSYLVGFVALGGAWESPVILTVAGAMVVYIALLTFVARREDDGSVGWRARLCVLMPLTIVVPAIVIANGYYVSGWAMACLALFLLWMLRSCWLLLRKSPDVRGAVMGWLSGICLFDASILALHGMETVSVVALGCFAVTAIGHRFVSGT